MNAEKEAEDNFGYQQKLKQNQDYNGLYATSSAGQSIGTDYEVDLYSLSGRQRRQREEREHQEVYFYSSGFWAGMHWN